MRSVDVRVRASPMAESWMFLGSSTVSREGRRACWAWRRSRLRECSGPSGCTAVGSSVPFSRSAVCVLLFFFLSWSVQPPCSCTENAEWNEQLTVVFLFEVRERDKTSRFRTKHTSEATNPPLDRRRGSFKRRFASGFNHHL